MQDLASEFSKIFRGWYARILAAGGATPSRTQHPALAGLAPPAVPVLGPKSWSHQLFSRDCAPGRGYDGVMWLPCCGVYKFRVNVQNVSHFLRRIKSRPEWKRYGFWTGHVGLKAASEEASSRRRGLRRYKNFVVRVDSMVVRNQHVMGDVEPNGDVLDRHQHLTYY